MKFLNLLTKKKFKFQKNKIFEFPTSNIFSIYKQNETM